MSLGAQAVVFSICNAASGVTNLLKSGSVLRLFPGGYAPQDQPLNYATQQTVGGHTENSMDSASRADNERVQIDCWADNIDNAATIASAIRTALEDSSAQSSRGVGIRTITPPSGDFDPETKRSRVMFEVSVWTTQ